MSIHHRLQVIPPIRLNGTTAPANEVAGTNNNAAITNQLLARSDPKMKNKKNALGLRKDSVVSTWLSPEGEINGLGSHLSTEYSFEEC